ncbi:MAG TPA: hypothetical protein VI338_01600 [Nitrososphaera sp.]|nr:hypothetical protein [Nitrososphaera sp.]
MPEYNDLVTRTSFGPAHEQIQELLINLKEQYRLEALFDRVISEQGVAISPAAQLMLIVPLLEADAMHSYWEERGVWNTPVDVDRDTVQESLRQLVLEAKKNPARIDQFPDELVLRDHAGNKWPARSTFSIIKSFVSRFCNIPPFCGEKAPFG